MVCDESIVDESGALIEDEICGWRSGRRKTGGNHFMIKTRNLPAAIVYTA